MIGGTVIRGDEMLALGGFVTVVKGVRVILWSSEKKIHAQDASLISFFSEMIFF